MAALDALSAEADVESDAPAVPADQQELLDSCEESRSRLQELMRDFCDSRRNSSSKTDPIAVAMADLDIIDSDTWQNHDDADVGNELRRAVEKVRLVTVAFLSGNGFVFFRIAF